MDGSTSARSPIIANPTPYVRPSFYPERGRAAAGVAPSGDAACYRYLHSQAMPHNAGCTYPHIGSIYQNAIPTPSTSPFRVPVSGMSNLRQFWPPTPPPDGFGRLGMNPNLYPMYPAVAPLAPSSDNGMQGLIPRIGSSPSHYPHFFDAHKESSFLSPGLTIASPLTPTSSFASSTPISSLPPSYDKSQPFSPMSLSLKSTDLCRQQYCQENDDIQRVEMYSDAVCHHPVTDQQRPGSANMEANSKREKITENGIYHPHQESHPHSVLSKSDSKLLKNNTGAEKKHCNKSEQDYSTASSNNTLKSSSFQENLLEPKTCKVKKSKNSQCLEHIDVVTVSDDPRSSEGMAKSHSSDACSEKPRHKNCCVFPTSASAVVTSTPVTTSTSVTYSHPQFTASSQLYSSVSDLQMKKETEENRHDCQFAKSACGKSWSDRSFVELCYCHSENGRKSCHIAHTSTCKVSKMPKAEPSQSSCCAQRLSNHQECSPFMYQSAIYESNNHSNQMNGKCAHLSLPQNDAEQLSPAWNVLHSPPNHLQLDAISKSTSIPELSGSSKEYKLPYPSEFLPDIQPLNFSSNKSQQHDSKTLMQNSLGGSKERATSASLVDAHSPSLEKKTPTTTSSTVVGSSGNSNIPVGIAIAQQRHSMSSAWKLGKLTDPHFPAAHNGSDGFPSLPNTSACHKNDNILRDQPYLSVKSIPTLPSNHSGLLVSPAAKQWESDTVPRAVLPHTWLRHGRVVAPGMWIGQGNYASATPTTGLPIGPLDSAQVSVPPVGYQLVRDSLTGHILLIPAVNIELVDGAQLWPKLENSASLHQQSTPQMQHHRYYQVPPEEDKLEHEESAAVHSTKPLATENLHNEKKLLTAETDEEVQTVESPASAANIEIPVASRVFEHSPLHPEKHLSTSLHNCEHRPTISLAQAPVAVQTEHAKRSQATSPLISVPITLHQPNKQKVNSENLTSDKQNKSSTSNIPSNFCDGNHHQKTFAIQVNLEKPTNAVNIEEEWKTIHSAEKKNEKYLKENEALEQTTNVDTMETLQRKHSSSPGLLLECHLSPNFIDHRGLNLLVDSIEELNCKNLTLDSEILTEKCKPECSISFTDNLQKSQASTDKVCKSREQEYSSFPSLKKSSADSLQILCALAEQRFIEETRSDVKSPLPSASGELCDSSTKADKSDLSKEKTGIDKTFTRSLSDKSKQRNFPEDADAKTPSEVESKEAEMRRRLAELQQKYKQKQKELAHLQPRKGKKKNISTQRCPGRPHSIRPYMYYRIRKEKMMSKSGSSHLLRSLPDDHNTGVKRNSPSENKKCLSSNEDKKNKFQLRDLQSASKGLKKTKRSGMKLVDNTLRSKRHINDECSVKGENLSLKKRAKKNLLDKRKVSSKDIIQQENQQQIEVISFHKPSEVIYNKDTQLNINASTTPTCENIVSSNNLIQKELATRNGIFQKDVSEVSLCGECCERYEDKSETQQNLCNVNHNNENSAGYEGDTSDVEVPPAKKRKMGKPKKHSKQRELNGVAVLKPTENFLATKTNETFTAGNSTEPETKALKLLHHLVKQPEISKSKKKMKLKKSFEPSPKKVKSRDHRKREKEDDVSMTDELFAALKKCRLSESNVVGPSTAGDGKEHPESSSSEGENIPLIALIEKSAVASEVKSCTLSLEDLCDKTRVLIMEEGLYYAGFITAIRAPDVYGITLDGERGNKPRIYSREEMLTACILELKPTSLRELPEGRRVCAFWSQQYRCLYPGAVGKVSPQKSQDKPSVFVEFDDGDSGSIPIDDIRFLLQTVDNVAASDLCSTSKLPMKLQLSNDAKEGASLETLIKTDVGISKNSNDIGFSDKGNTDEENGREKKGKTSILQDCSEEIMDVSLTETVVSQKKKHITKGTNSKKSKKSSNEIRHCSSKREGKRKRSDKCSENVSPKLKKHKKSKEDRKRNRRHNHRHHRRHHHHHRRHHHKKHKHDKSKAQSGKQSLLPLDSNNTKEDMLQMSSTSPAKSFCPSVSEADSAVTVLSDFDKLVGKKEQNRGSDDIAQFLSNIKVTSDNLQDVVKEDSATEAQPELQLWSWYGKSFRRPGSKRKARKEYYRAIIRGNEILKVGDCAVFVSSGRPHLPYVGQIETMWQSWGGSMVVKVKWFYHPEEMKQNIDLSSYKGALFQSTHVDENDVQTISHKCILLTKQEYKRRMDLRRNTQYKEDTEDIYYLAGSYDPISGVVIPELEYA